jgi:lipopolysaccharide export system permease protein
MFVPFANDRAAFVKQQAIEHATSATTSSLQAITPLPGGGKQVTIASALDVPTQTLLKVTVLRYDAHTALQDLIVADRARYVAPTWHFENATQYHYYANGDESKVTAPLGLDIDIGARPNQIAKQSLQLSDPELLSRAEIKERLASGQLTPQQVKSFQATYASKLARPFAAFVFTLIAVPFGLRPVRGGGTGLGFGLAVAIVFVYYVISTIFLSIGTATGLAGPAAWTPNLLFTVIGATLLRRASRV